MFDINNDGKYDYKDEAIHYYIYENAYNKKDGSNASGSKSTSKREKAQPGTTFFSVVVGVMIVIAVVLVSKAIF